MKSFITILMVLLLTAVSVQAAGVAVGASSLMIPDYSDTMTIPSAGAAYNRDNVNTFDWYPWAGFPEALNVEQSYGNAASSWDVGWNWGQAFRDNKAGGVAIKTGLGNPGDVDGVMGITTGDTSMVYGMGHDQFVLQTDAMLASVAGERLDLYVAPVAGAWIGNDSADAIVVFIRGTGDVQLFNKATGDKPTGLTTGVTVSSLGGDADIAWHNYAVLFDVVADTMELFVDEVSRGVLNLTTFEGGLFSGIPDEYAGIGGSSAAGDNVVLDNYQIGAVPEPATMMLLGMGALALIRRRRA